MDDRLANGGFINELLRKSDTARDLEHQRAFRGWASIYRSDCSGSDRGTRHLESRGVKQCS